MAKIWDHMVKMLARENPQAFVSFVLEGARFEAEADRQLIANEIEADLLYIVSWQGQRIVLHIEFQSKNDEEMGRRVWAYNVLADYLLNLPVISVVIYLTRRGTIVEPPYERRLSNGHLIQVLHFSNLKLWEVAADDLKRPGLEVLLPLLPLTRSGKRREVVLDMIECLKTAGRADLLSISYTLAAKVFRKGEDQIWLKEVFTKMYDFLEDSWAFQEIKAEGLKQGIKEGIQQGMQQGMQQGKMEEAAAILRTGIEARFPALHALLEQQLQRTSTLDALHLAIRELFTAQTIEEARQILLRLTTPNGTA